MSSRDELRGFRQKANRDYQFLASALLSGKVLGLRWRATPVLLNAQCRKTVQRYPPLWKKSS